MKALPDLKHILLFSAVLCACLIKPAQSQIPVLELTSEIDGHRITELVAMGTTEELHPPEYIWNKFLIPENREGSSFGFTMDYHWVMLSVINRQTKGIWLVEIENPHINFLQMYVRGGEYEDWTLLDDTGRLTPFSTRRVAHFNFLFPVEPELNDKLDILIKLDKKRSSIHYHTRIWSVDKFNRSQQIHYASYGIYFGMFLLLIFVMGVAYVLSLSNIYLSFLLYVLSVGLFVFNDTGLAHQYLYPWSDTAGGYMRIALTFMMVITFTKFTQHYFNTKRYSPGLNHVLNLMLIFIFIQGLIYLFFTEFYRANATIMIIWLYGTVLVVILLALIVSVYYTRIEKQVAILFVTSFSFIFIAGIFFILQEFGLLHEFQFLFTPIQIGSALQIIFLSVAIAWRVRLVEKGQFELKERINRLQTENLMAFINGSEKERNRIAMELHDAIGNRLGHVKRSLRAGSEAVDYVKNEISEIISDVRSISHKLAPPSMNLTGIEQNIRQLIKQTNKSSEIEYTFQALDIPKDLPEEFTIQLYRIVQESIQNIEKHSRAARADIQLICHQNELVLTIEDDGIGFDKLVINNGIGLDNIKKRVNYLNGTFEMSGLKNRGVHLIFTFPIPGLK